MNNKGFTLVELITTFALSSVIIILLLNVIILIKNIYTETNLKTELYINQANLSNVLNEKFKNNQSITYKSCDNTDIKCHCYNFEFEDNEEIKLNVCEDNITFGNYVYNTPERVSIDVENVVFLSASNPSSRFEFSQLKIPIKSNLYPNIDFGINLIYFN